MKRWLTDGVVSFLGRRGYRISRHMFHQESEIDLRMLLGEHVEREKSTLSVVQIGANDGVTNDPLYHLVQSRGWSLLAVEPLGPAFRRLASNYAAFPNVKCVQCAVAGRDGELTLYALDDASGSDSLDDQLASFSREILMRHWRHIPRLAERIVPQTVRAVTLRTLLRENGVDSVDLLQLDTEGFDFEIIKMAFAMGLKPSILAFEWEHLDQKQMWDCRSALIDAGYRWLVVKGDVVAAHASLLELR